MRSRIQDRQTMARLKFFAVFAALVTLAPHAGAVVAQGPTGSQNPYAAEDTTAAAIAVPITAETSTATTPAAAVVDNVAGPDSRWPYYQEIALPAEPSSDPYFDFIVPPSVFDQARTSDFGDSGAELADLRLLDADGNTVPYALRVRTAVNTTETVATTEFNRTTTTDGASELTLDLGATPPYHNEMEVSLGGQDYRRRAILEGSDDASTWQKITERNLVWFKEGDREFDGRKFTYSPSRFRYLRLRVYPDPVVDKDPVSIVSVTVKHQMTVPAELITLPATLERREPTRANGAPASAWIIDLGANHMPVQRINVDVAEPDFNREYVLQAGGPPDSGQGFQWATSGTWTRAIGDPPKPLVAETTGYYEGRSDYSPYPSATTDNSPPYLEIHARRLRLEVVDHSNPPLTIKGVTFTAAARQVIFANTPGLKGPLRLYYGNSLAEPPHYDLQGTLPARLEPAPRRLSLAGRQANDNFQPEPMPFTERWPWTIYLALGAVSVVLAAVVLSLSRTAIARADLAAAGV
jgi:hypothetical protein